MTEEIEYKSKTQRKKEAEALQELGLKLTGLSIQQLERSDLPMDLKTALIEARSITSNVAGRRQRQFIGALMRDVDPEIIRRALAQAEMVQSVMPEPVLKAREWIDRLLAGGSQDVEALVERCPGLERQRLRQLLRNIQKAPGKSSKSRKVLEQLIISEMK